MTPPIKSNSLHEQAPSVRPLHLYMGDLDLVNGIKLDSATIDRLKLQALLYDCLLVYDGFTWCYGPLTAHFEHIINDNYNLDPVYQLLVHGILIPSTRTNKTLLDIYENDPYVTPGRHLILPRERKAVVQLISEACGTHRISRTVSDHNLKWAETIRTKLLPDDSAACLRKIATRLDTGKWNKNKLDCALAQLDEVLKILNTLTDSNHLKTESSLPPDQRFARRTVENLVGEKFGISVVSEPTFGATVYGKAAELARIGSAQGDPRYLIADQLLRALITSNQSVYASKFEVYSSLFRRHDRDVAIVVSARHEPFEPFSKLTKSYSILPDLAPRLDLSRLTVRKIIELREKPLSKKCRDVLRIWLDAIEHLSVNDAKNFDELSNDLENYLAEYYNLILATLGYSKRKKRTDAAVYFLPLVATGIGALIAMLGGDIVTTAPFFIPISAVPAAVKPVYDAGHIEDEAIRRKLRKVMWNYANPRR